MEARIIEQGNSGFPDAGDYCSGGGYLYRVVSIASRIQTGDPRGYYVWAEVEEAPWSACDEDEEHGALVELEPTCSEGE